MIQIQNMKLNPAALSISCAVVVLLLKFAALPVQAALLQPLPLWSDNRTKITVCTSSWTPMVDCDPETGKK
jgi:hypothetical protein